MCVDYIKTFEKCNNNANAKKIKMQKISCSKNGNSICGYW